MTGTIVFAPLIPIQVLVFLCLLAVAVIVYAAWGRLNGWWLRGAGLVVLLMAVANPSIQEEDQEKLSDIVIAVVDETASQMIGGRQSQSDDALSMLMAEVAARENTELRIKRVEDGEDDTGTALMGALSDALSKEPQARIAGAFLITDGQVHDSDLTPNLSAPLHVLLTGEPRDWDRRLVIKNAPGFAIIGEEVELSLRIEDQGMVPPGEIGQAEIEFSVDGGPPVRAMLPTGEDLSLPITLQHGGMNVIQFKVATAPGELTDRNNSAVVQVNGVRDRLRVLLVSGEPHPGERTWRNLLKSDSAVDLVHFTILRPPEKQDGVPVTELSLIAFPTRELFLEKIDEFDLIIFDRYKRRGILPSLYLQNVTEFVRRGGAVLFAAGPDFATVDSLFRSPLSEIIPGAPTSRIIQEGYTPEISEVGNRHPVTRGLQEFAPPDGWGRWLRLIEVDPLSGNTVLEAQEGRPLLILDRVDEGRVALLASDHAWLWSRGYEGGGPQLELLRRLAHWMMKEPDLEEEALTATATGQNLIITRRTLSESVGEVTVTGPDGSIFVLPLVETSPGVFEAEFDAPEIGLFRLSEGELESVIAVGPSAPREFEETIATETKLAGFVQSTGGGVMRLSNGLPDIRDVRQGRTAFGRGWLGITPRNAYLTENISIKPVLPPWAFLFLASLLIIGAWVLEGRRSNPVSQP